MAQEITFGVNRGSSIIHIVEVHTRTVERRYRHIITGEVYSKMEEVTEYIPVCSSGKFYINASKRDSDCGKITAEAATCKRCAKSRRV